MHVPDVSVVIPTHDRRELLPRMIECALTQRDVDLEVVVVDDGSSDGTWTYLTGHPDPRIRPIRQDPARGEAGARNRGVEEARGGWVAFADDDDLWSPDKLRAQLAAAEEVPDAGWVCTGSVEVDEHLDLLGWEPCPQPGEEVELLARNVIPGGGSGVLARTALVRRAGGFDPALRQGADRDLWIRLWLAAPLTSVDRPLVAHVVHGASISQRGSGRLESFDYLAAKYADERARFGVALDPQVLTSYADALVLGGARGEAARLYARTARRFGRPSLWAKATAAAVAPELLHRRWRQATADWVGSIPEPWRAEVERWLAPHRSAGGAEIVAAGAAAGGTAAPGPRQTLWDRSRQLVEPSAARGDERRPAHHDQGR